MLYIVCLVVHVGDRRTAKVSARLWEFRRNVRKTQLECMRNDDKRDLYVKEMFPESSRNIAEMLPPGKQTILLER